jgi:hypothetical protein
MFPSAIRPLVRARNTIVVPAVIDAAVALCQSATARRSAVTDASARNIAIDGAFGLRGSEGYGLRRADTMDRNFRRVWIRGNTTRHGKTAAARRKVAMSLASAKMQEVLETAYDRTLDRAWTDPRSAVMADPASRDQLVPETSVLPVSGWALKAASGDPMVVHYSLRHTYVTRIQLHLTAPTMLMSPVAARAAMTLKLD